MINYLLIPGLGNSGEEHWQTYFERSNPGMLRVNQREWDAPDCREWVETIERTAGNYLPDSLVLIGHSLGCSTIIHWAAKYGHRIRGAMLVAPSDVDAPAYDFPATGFGPVPLDPPPFKTIVVASSNDPWVSIDRAAYFARKWQSAFVNIGDAGHINAASGHGPWQQGLEILARL